MILSITYNHQLRRMFQRISFSGFSYIRPGFLRGRPLHNTLMASITKPDYYNLNTWLSIACLSKLGKIFLGSSPGHATKLSQAQSPGHAKIDPFHDSQVCFSALYIYPTNDGTHLVFCSCLEWEGWPYIFHVSAQATYACTCCMQNWMHCH